MPSNRDASNAGDAPSDREGQNTVRAKPGPAKETADVVTAPTTPRRAPFQPGERLDDYIVGDVLGEGGMGIVLAAHDPDLDRPVAIKVLRRSVFGAHGVEAARFRLRREAQAMAKLSHPNVITVYRVGDVDDQVFVAMELVEGGTLRDWLATARSHEEILEQFLSAGRGLAAAHAADLVHRDFKPDNVLVGLDGRVRVTDFGLVTSGGVADDDLDDRATPLASIGLTNTGAVMGTPAYMAPEQHAGQPADARADQFAFCVALYEALYHERPFAGATYQELVVNVMAGKVHQPVTDLVSARIRRVLLRGMERDPDRRFGALTEVLAALAGDRLGLGRERLETIWDADRKRLVRAAFETTGALRAGEVYDRVAEILDTRAARWIELYDESAELRRHKDRPEQMLDRRDAALEQRLRELAQFVHALITRTDASSVDRAILAAAELSSLERCADGSSVSLAPRLPNDPDKRDKIALLESRIEDINAADRLDQVERGLRDALAIAADVTATHHPPLIAGHLFALGTLQKRWGEYGQAGTSFRRAALAAVEAADPVLEARALCQLVHVVVARGEEYARAEDLSHAAWRAVVRAGSAAELVEFESIVGEIEHQQDNHANARERYERAIKLWDRDLAADPSHRRLGGVLHARLASLLDDMLDFAGARLSLDRARAIFVDAFGENHPCVADLDINLGVIEEHCGDHERSHASATRALAIYRHAYGEENPRVALALGNAGTALLKLGLVEPAFSVLEQALALRRRVFAAKPLEVATFLANLGADEVRVGRASARAHLEEALAIRIAAMPADHPEIANARGVLGMALEVAGQFEAAASEYRIAAQLFAALDMKENEAIQEHHLGTLWFQRDVQIALVHLDRAESAWQVANPDPNHPPALATRFLFAQLLWHAGRRDRAIELAGRCNDPGREMIAGWLATAKRD